MVFEVAVSIVQVVAMVYLAIMALRQRITNTSNYTLKDPHLLWVRCMTCGRSWDGKYALAFSLRHQNGTEGHQLIIEKRLENAN